MKHSVLFAACSIMALSACTSSSVKDTLGLNRQAPDEFRVVARPPLSVPPQFSLRPPSTNAESPTMVPADKQAQAVILGAGKAAKSENTNSGNSFSLKEGAAETAVTPVTSAALPKTDKASASESQFLKNIGADKADPNVRSTLVEQQVQAQEKQEEASWWDSFSSNSEKKDPLVDAKGEAQRIRTNKDEGKPVTEGQTPETKDKDRGVLGRWLGW